MAPKKKPPKQLGDVQQIGNGSRVFVNIDGQNFQGPTRSLHSHAQRDLARARRCKTREDMQAFVQSLHGPQPLAGPAAVTQNHTISRQSLDELHRNELLGGQPLAAPPEVVESASSQRRQDSGAQSLTGGAGLESNAHTESEACVVVAQSHGDRCLMPQSLAGRFGRSAKEKRAARLERQRPQQRTLKYHLARRSRKRQTEYIQLAKRRARESAPQAKASRIQQKWMRFWEPCLFNWKDMRQHSKWQAKNNAAVYAPRFHKDGRISILQHDAFMFLPCPDEPGAGADQKQLEEFGLALALRCRIGAINCRRGGDDGGCCSRWTRRAITEVKASRKTSQGYCKSVAPASGSAWPPRENVPVLPFGGCIHNKRLHRFTWQCEFQGYSDADLHHMAELYQQEWADVADDFAAVAAANPALAASLKDPTNVYSADAEGIQQSRALPTPSKELGRFLCNSQCPKQCATLHCPWNSMRNHECTGPEQVMTIFGSPCMCKLSSCLHCVQERSLQKFQDYPSRVACSRWTTLLDPPPFGFTVYEGLGEPVSDSFSAKRKSKLYRLECVRWTLEQRVVRKPPAVDRTSFLDLSLPELLHFNGYNTPEMYRRPVRSYRDTLQPLLDSYVVDNCFIFKLYDPPRKVWTPHEARHWNAQTERMEGRDVGISESSPASGSRDSVESGWEWRWQEDVEAGTKDSFKVGGQWKVASEAFTTECDRFEEWVHLADGRAVSTRCDFCTFVHGPPNVPAGSGCDGSVSRYRLPEDVAIGFAKRVAQLRATINGHVVVVRPADVIAVVDRVSHIVASVEGFPKSVGRVDILSAVGGCSPTAELDAAASLAVDDFVGAILGLANGMRVRVEKLLEAGRVNGWKPAADSEIRAGLSSKSLPRQHRMVIDRVRYECDLDHDFTQEALKQRGFESPIFALVDDLVGVPRQTRGATEDCSCEVPWHMRSIWQRAPWVVYELPPVHEEWESVWLESDQCIAWAYRGKDSVDQPLAVVNEKPAARHVPPSCIAQEAERAAVNSQPLLNRHFDTRGSKQPSGSGDNDFVAWASDDEAGALSDICETQHSEEGINVAQDDEEDEEEEVHAEQHDEEAEVPSSGDDSEPLDVDVLESGDGCPATPPRRARQLELSTLARSAQKETEHKHHSTDVLIGSYSEKRSKPQTDSLVPASGSTATSADLAANEHRTRETLVRINKSLRRKLVRRHPQLREYEWFSGQCRMCEEWAYESECTFAIKHCCGLVHCAWCYEEHLQLCKDQAVQSEIQTTREAIFTKHPELRRHTPVSGCCSHCLEELDVAHEFLFEHCCGSLVCSDCYVHHLPYCEGGACRYDAFVFGDDGSSDDYGIGYGPDARDETW